MNNGDYRDSGAPTVPFFSRFQTRLALLVLLVCVPALVLTIYTNFGQRQVEKARVRESAVALAKLAAANQQNFVKNTRQLLASVSQATFLVRGKDRRVCDFHFANLRALSPDYLDFGLIETDGTLFSSAAHTNGSVNLSDRVFFQRVLQTKRFSVGDYQTNSLTARPTLDFGYPILNERGELIRILYGSLDVALMGKAASDVQLPAQAGLTLFDSKGTVLAHQPDSVSWIGKRLSNEPFVQRVLRGNATVFQMSGADGAEQLFAVASINDGQEQSLFVSIGVPTQTVFAEANRSLAKNVLILGIITAFALALAHLYAKRSLVQPLHRVVLASRQLASGRLSARAKVSDQRGELAELARAFDEMASKLEQRQIEIDAAHAEMNRLNVELEQRVKDRTAELQLANRELEAFNYSVSHDLRAPLRHIGGYAELLLQSPDVTLGDEGRRHLDVMTNSARKMSKLIDDLLKFSRMGRDSMRIAQCDMAQLVREAMLDVSPSAQGRLIEWNVAALPKVTADANMMKQVWINLLSNAIKYTRKRDQAIIAVGVNERDGEYEFHVRDNGSGFDMRYAERLFGVFQRLHSDSDFEGTGVGLANVRRIVERHRGRTWADATVNQGATFYFTLPKG